MKRIHQIVNPFYLSIILLGLLFSCKKSTDFQVNPEKPTLMAYISHDKELSLLFAAIQRAGMDKDETFSSGEAYTFFAPVDTAMIAAGFTLDKINQYSPKDLAMVLKYHIVIGNLGSNALAGFYSQPASSLNTNYSPTVTKNYYGIFINGSRILQSGIALGNGLLLNKIGNVVFPSTADLYNTIKNMPELSYFNAVVAKIPQYEAYLKDPKPDTVTYYQENINGQVVTGNLTVHGQTIVAPSNNAFKAIGYPDIASLNSASIDDLTTLISYSFFYGDTYTSDLLGGAPDNGGSTMRARYNGANFSILDDGRSFKSNRNLINPKLIKTNITTNNGVLHVIDQIIPNF